MKITVNIPDKISHKETYIVNTETDCKALKSRLEKKWRKYLRRYKPIVVPIRCAYCAHVGENMWHCHNPESTHNHLNVMPNSVCSKWSPNMGLLIYLWKAWADEHYGPYRNRVSSGEDETWGEHLKNEREKYSTGIHDSSSEILDDLRSDRI